MSTTGDTTPEIRSFQIEIPQKRIDDLGQRIAAMRWPTKELVPDRSQGVDRGGHFAAWEEPELFSTEVRAAFSSLRW